MQPGDQVQKCGFPTAGGPDNTKKLASPHLKVDVIQREQPFSALRAVAQTDFAKSHFRDRRSYTCIGMADGNRPKLRSIRRHARSKWNGIAAWNSVCIGTHWIAFRFFSASTWLRSVKSY